MKKCIVNKIKNKLFILNINYVNFSLIFVKFCTYCIIQYSDLISINHFYYNVIFKHFLFYIIIVNTITIYGYRIYILNKNNMYNKINFLSLIFIIDTILQIIPDTKIKQTSGDLCGHFIIDFHRSIFFKIFLVIAKICQ